MTERFVATSQVSELADRAFSRSEFDFRQLHGHPSLLLDRVERRGISLIAAQTSVLPEDAIEAILAWRLGQYLLTGFYDPEYVTAHGLVGEPRNLVHDDDVHGLAIDDEGRLNTYLTIKKPELTEQEKAVPFAANGRPAFPCEDVHGREWHADAVGLDHIRSGSTWEMGRFVTDQRAGSGAGLAGHRGPVEIALAAARLAMHPTFDNECDLIVGDLDPDVALRNLRFFYMPVATYQPHVVSLSHEHPLWPRYANAATAPFLALFADVDHATFIRWSDVNIALSCADEEFALRMLAMRQFVSIRESSLKRPKHVPTDSAYPVAALASPSSLGASSALLHAAERQQIPWRALHLGPGDTLPKDCVTWIVDGFARATIASSNGQSHLAAMGPEIAFVPQDGLVDVLDTVEVVTPVRALVTSVKEFESFWSERQTVFETSTESLYGDIVV